MNDTINKIKELLGMEVKEEIVLMDEKVLEEPKEDVIEDSAMEAIEYATKQELSDVKSELLSMIKTIIEENEKKVKEIPQELSSDKEVEKVELSEVEEIIHSPENEVKKETVQFSKPFGAMSIAERINEMLNNK
jgi:hypothetical protein